MSSALRFGVIGCGEIAAQTCEGISAASNTSIAMLMDERPEVLADLAEFYGVPTTLSIGDVLSNPEVDAVYVATPHNTHMPIGVAAARAGKHVLMEKPIATTLADADAIIAACQQNGVKLGVAFYAQVDAAISTARDLVRAGMLGDIISLRLSTLANKPEYYWSGGYTRRVRTSWRTSKAQAGGGVLMMNLIHDLNTVRWVTGLEAARVYAEYGTLTTPVEVEDTIGVLVRYNNDAIGVLQGGSAFRGGAHEDIRGPRIYGTRGQLILAEKPLIYLQEPPEGGVPNTWQPVRYSGPLADRQQIVSRFAAAVLSGQEPPVSGLDGRKVLEIVLAAYRSGELRQPVDLPL
jgi:UDP-N-acetyl-2-amino-2-deoxyglucuronate dehydrogenase